MGRKSSAGDVIDELHEFALERSKTVGDGVWEWEEKRSFLQSQSDEWVRRAVEALVWETHDGHALSQDDLRTLRQALQLDATEHSDQFLFRHTDELVVMVGYHVCKERRLPAQAHIKLVDAMVGKAVKKLISALGDKELEHECEIAIGVLKIEDVQSLQQELDRFLKRLDEHCTAIAGMGGKGKTWDSELKAHHVYHVACLAEFLNHDFEPKRRVDQGYEDAGPFTTLVDLLGKPLKWGTMQSDEVQFQGAIRKHVDRWNKRLAAYSEAMRARHMDENA